MALESPDRYLSRLISEAAFNPAKWVEVCDAMGSVSSSAGAILVPVEVAQRALGLPHSAELDGLVSDYLDEEWYKHDVRERSLPALLRRGFVTDADCIAHDEIGRSSYYQELLARLGFRWFAGIAIQAQDTCWVLSLQRGLHAEPFSEEEVGKLLAYRSLLNSSASIARQIGFAYIRGASDMFEQQGLSVIALDTDERVVYVSASAERHLTESLRLADGKLYARDGHSRAPLAQLIRSICSRNILASRLAVSLARSGDLPPLTIYGRILPDAEYDLFKPAVALLVISDPDRPRQIPSAFLAEYFALTPAETVLAVSILRGISLDQHASDHSISPVTVRNHLQALFRKTSTHRQSDLLAAMNRVLPGP